jgi:hypothetical protein
MLHRTVGYKQGPQFIADGAAALDTTRQLVTNILKYQTGNREPQILYNLALGLAEAGAPDANLEKEYLKTQEGNALIRKENYDFILRAQSGYRGEAFKVLLANREKFYTVAPAESINDFISSTLFRTLQYAVGNNMNLLADSVMTDLRQFQEPLRSQFLAYAEILKNANNSDREKYFSAMIQYIETYGSRDMEKKSAYAMELANTRQPDKLDKAITWMNSVLEQDKSLKNYEMMAYIYLAAGKKSEAQSISEQGIKVAENIDGDDSALREYLRQATQ